MQQINQEHPEYAADKAMWRKYRHLYAGGESMRACAAEYLTPRNKEPGDVYHERLSRVFYENYVGSIIDWYAATLMRREPVLSYEGNNDTGKSFFATFSDDCDLKGTTLTDFFRRQFVELLISGKSYVVVDFPRTGPAANRAEEDALGQSRAFLADYSAEEVINWSYDSSGQLDWVVLRNTWMQQARVTDTSRVKETRWVYYDRETFQIYQAGKGEKQGDEPRLISEGRHGLAAQGRVPLFQLQITDGLWLMNKAALLQLEHFNKSNALSWALTMGLFATPVVYSDREWNQIVGESYYIQLGPDDRFGWTEPEGKVFQIAADNLERLKDEIYRVCYLMNQAASGGSTQITSALSKQRDYSVTQEVLRAYGDAVKHTMKQVLGAIQTARQDELAIDVSGLDEFDIGDFSSELDDAKKLMDMGIQSVTLQKQLLATIYLAHMKMLH